MSLKSWFVTVDCSLSFLSSGRSFYLSPVGSFVSGFVAVERWLSVFSYWRWGCASASSSRPFIFFSGLAVDYEWTEVKSL